MQAPSPAVSAAVPADARLASAAWSFSQRHWRIVVVAMLALLHVAVLRGTEDDWARALMLAHLGLMLLWQPFLRGEHRISATQGVFIGLVAIAVMLWIGWWLLAFWVVVLAGLVGGKVFLHHARWQRRCYLLVLTYLLALLVIIILPEIAPGGGGMAREIRDGAEYGLPLLLLAVALMPAETEPAESAQVIDFFYSIFLMLVLSIVILGSFTFMTLGRIPYLEALTKTVFLIAGTILVLGLAWSPSAGVGLHLFFSRYLFSIGLPVEKWLYFLAELSRMEAKPKRFLAEGVAGLARLPWIAGAAWQTGNQHGEVGTRSGHAVVHAGEGLELTIYSRYRTSPALQWHMHLLGQLLAEFYAAKLREEMLQESSYLQAIHETGARLTHDVKNLLQSLNVLCTVAIRDESPDSQALIRRQLPAIAQRLSATLEKLQSPGGEESLQVPLREWWEDLARRYQGQGVDFSSTGVEAGNLVPKSLLDGVAENLLQNAIAKRAGDRVVRIQAAIKGGAVPELRVCDSGAAVTPDVANALFRAPVRSGAGLGIGLYQAARRAESSGYTLALADNRDGEVCFVLKSAGAAAAT